MLSPSTALSTEMAGVIMPSPYSSAAPNNPNAMRPTRPARPARALTSATSARMPPSPALSARMTNSRYFTDTTMTSDHAMSDSTPSTFARDTSIAWGPVKHSRSA